MELLALSDGSYYLIAVLLGGGFISGLVALRKVGPERTSTVIGYQGEVIDDLNVERERLKAERDELRSQYESLARDNRALREECDDLRRRIERLERQAEPPAAEPR